MAGLVSQFVVTVFIHDDDKAKRLRLNTPDIPLRAEEALKAAFPEAEVEVVDNDMAVRYDQYGEIVPADLAFLPNAADLEVDEFKRVMDIT